MWWAISTYSSNPISHGNMSLCFVTPIFSHQVGDPFLWHGPADQKVFFFSSAFWILLYFNCSWSTICIDHCFLLFGGPTCYAHHMPRTSPPLTLRELHSASIVLLLCAGHFLGFNLTALSQQSAPCPLLLPLLAFCWSHPDAWLYVTVFANHPLGACFSLFLYYRKKVIVQSTKDSVPNSWDWLPDPNALATWCQPIDCSETMQKERIQDPYTLLFISNAWLWASTVWSP